MLLTFRSHMHTSDVTNMLIIFFWIKLPLKLPNFLIIQKRDRHFSVTGFAQMLKPNTFEGAHYKRWRQRCILWFTSMHCFFIVEPRPFGPHTAEDEQQFINADNTFKGAMISVLGESVVDTYVTMSTGKEMWDALEAQYGASYAGSELYVMEQFHDY